MTAQILISLEIQGQTPEQVLTPSNRISCEKPSGGVFLVTQQGSERKGFFPGVNAGSVERKGRASKGVLPNPSYVYQSGKSVCGIIAERSWMMAKKQRVDGQRRRGPLEKNLQW